MSKACPVFCHSFLHKVAEQRGEATFCRACGLAFFGPLQLHEGRSEYGSREKCPFFAFLQVGISLCLDLVAREIMLESSPAVATLGWPELSSSTTEADRLRLTYLWLCDQEENSFVLNIMKIAELYAKRKISRGEGDE